MFSNLFPGFGIALVAFTAYVVVDQLVHPANVEQLKKQARESAERPTIIGLLQGKKEPHSEEQ
jgi:TRAP-type mannitol/chloroaromatic compound transport system permease large subunit